MGGANFAAGDKPINNPQPLNWQDFYYAALSLAGMKMMAETATTHESIPAETIKQAKETINKIQKSAGKLFEKGNGAEEKGILSIFGKTAKGHAYDVAKQILSTRPKGKVPRAVSAIVDGNSGKVYIGESGKSSLENLNSDVKNKLPDPSREDWNAENCAEVDAYNQAYTDGVNPKNMEMHTVKIDKKTGEITDFERCDNCKITTSDVGNVSSDPN